MRRQLDRMESRSGWEHCVRLLVGRIGIIFIFALAVWVGAAPAPEAEWGCIDLNVAIPAGESSVETLLVLPDGRVLGGCGGRAAHLFLYEPGTDYVTLLKSWQTPGFVRDLSLASDGRVWFVVGPGRGAVLSDVVDAQVEHLYSAVIAGRDLSLTDHGAPFKGEGIRCIAMDQIGGWVYGLSRPTPTLFRYSLGTGEFERLTDIGARRNYERLLTWTPPVERVSVDPQALLVGTYGVVYGATAWGRTRALFSWSPGGPVKDGEIKIAPVAGTVVPVASDRPQLGGDVVESLAWTADGRLFGGTHDGYVFIGDLAAGRTVNLGKPFRQAHIRDLAVGEDGTLYGICGELTGYPRLFQYREGEGYREITVSRKKPATWFDSDTYGALAVTPGGTIYIGGVGRMTGFYTCGNAGDPISRQGH